jgi:hypothetical protein
MAEQDDNPSHHRDGSLPIDPSIQATSQNPSHNNTDSSLSSQPLVELARDVPDLSDFVRELEGDVSLAKSLGQPVRKSDEGKEQMQWSDQATRTMLACVLKVEQNVGTPQGELVEVGQKGKMKRVPIKVSDNGLLKTTGTFVAWGLRKEGHQSADTAAVVNKWWRVRWHIPSESDTCRAAYITLLHSSRRRTPPYKS